MYRKELVSKTARGWVDQSASRIRVKNLGVFCYTVLWRGMVAVYRFLSSWFPIKVDNLVERVEDTMDPKKSANASYFSPPVITVWCKGRRLQYYNAGWHVLHFTAPLWAITASRDVRRDNTSWAGQDAQNKPISLCSAHFFEFGPEILTRDLDQAHQNSTRRTRKKKLWTFHQFHDFGKLLAGHLSAIFLLSFGVRRVTFRWAWSKSRVKISGPNFKNWEVHGQVST